MISKIDGAKNGYTIEEGATDAEMKEVWDQYPKVRCLIVSRITRNRFRFSLFGRNVFTINNRVPNDTFYINNFN